MARRASEANREAAALQGAIRAIARGERPLYRVSAAQDGSWAVEWCPWLPTSSGSRSEALAAARAAIAEWLDVPPDSFDVEVG